MTFAWVKGDPVEVFEVDTDKKGARRLRLTEIHHDMCRKGGRKILVAEHKWDLMRRMQEAGLSYKEAAEFAEVEPQGRWLLPLPPQGLFVARKGSKINEHCAIILRHFPENNKEIDQSLVERLNTAAKLIGKKLAERFKTVVGSWTNLDFTLIKPSGWTPERAEAALLDLGFTPDMRSRLALRKFFIKPNETLNKMKARGIQASSDACAMLQCITVKIMAEELFSSELCLARSIKHIPADQLGGRMSRFLSRFRGGKALSVDFRNWDATLLEHIRSNAENIMLETFYSEVQPRNDVVRKALRDRTKVVLNARSAHFRIEAPEFGRESGDGGTSVLNYATNFAMSLVLEWSLADLAGRPTTCEDCFDYRMKSKSWVDSFHEGDDTVFTFSKAFVARQGGPQQLLDRVVDFYRRLGLDIEPAGSGGVTFDAARAMSDVDGRVEFVSRLFVVGPVPFTLGLIPRTFRSASVTFSKGDLSSVAYSAALSGLYNHGRSPILRELYQLLRRTYVSPSARLLLDDGYRGRVLKDVFGIDPVGRIEAYLESCLDTDGTARGAYAREYPGLTVERQIEFENSLRSFDGKEEEMPAIQRLFAAVLAAC
jgi:hypothetical protein